MPRVGLEPTKCSFWNCHVCHSVTKAYCWTKECRLALISDSFYPYATLSRSIKGKRFMLYHPLKLVPSFLHAMTLSASTLPCGRYWWTSWESNPPVFPPCKGGDHPMQSRGPYIEDRWEGVPIQARLPLLIGSFTYLATYLCTDGVANHPLL